MERRTFLQLAGASTFQVFVLGALSRSAAAGAARPPMKYGPLVETGQGILDVPKGFKYTVVQKAGAKLSDGHNMPYQPDGMACFTDAEGRYVLLRNHELMNKRHLNRFKPVIHPCAGGKMPKEAYDPKYYGGVSRVVVSPQKLAQDLAGPQGGPSTAVVESNHVLVGTERNCGGGVVAGGWASCEESTTPGHGYAFLTLPDDRALVPPRRIDSWGRLHREAVVVDPRTGVVYMTEDRRNSCFYRFIPADATKPTGPGRVEALRIPGVEDPDPYPEPMKGVVPSPIWKPKQRWAVDWVPIDDPQAVERSCRQQGLSKGATKFNRNEGIAWDGQAAWFVASTGGPTKAGQIFSYRPDPDGKAGQLTLEYEVTDRTMLSCPDNLTMAPWGDLVLAEDNYFATDGVNYHHLRAMTPEGHVYDLARNRQPLGKPQSGGEFCGCCFSPDGRYLFVNVMFPQAVTIAIQGPWNA